MIILTYLLLTKYGSFGQKLFGLVLAFAISIGSSLAGAGLASLITNVSMTHTQVYQDSSRLLALILIKAIEIILFYGLAKRHYSLRVLQRKPVIVLTCAVIMIFSCFLFIFFNLSNFDEQANYILIWLAAGMLFILIGVFVMHEMFIREETRNINLSSRLQRLEMESHFFKELGAIQTDLRTWRHEYKNNLLALRALVEEGSSEKTLDYLDKISGESFQENIMLHTGNTVLDAVVSSKLMLARSAGIEVSIQAVYPEINQIEDNDLCAIVGNLLDNAIEACERMSKTEKNRFITFSLLIKGKNLVISILNSYNGEIKRAGDRYLTVKGNSLHGIGIQYIDSIVEKYQGHVLRKYQDGVFETHVMLPLISV
jgi:signal transduction histidine kinase